MENSNIRLDESTTSTAESGSTIASATEEEEESVEESVSQSVIDPILSFFSRHPTKYDPPAFPADWDPYSEDQAELKYLTTKPTCFVVLGKPGAGKTTLARSLANEWKSQLVNATILISDALRKDTDLGKRAKAVLHNGEEVPDELVIELMAEKLKSAEVAHQGYVLDGFPTVNEEFLTVKEQIELILSWDMKPDFIINIKLPNKDLENRRVTQKFDPVTGEIYTKAVYDPVKPDVKKKPSSKDTQEEEEEEEEEEEVEEEEGTEETGQQQQGIAGEVLSRLLQRPEDVQHNVEESIRRYNAKVLRLVEDYMAEHNQQYLIELDGNKPVNVLLQELLERLSCFPLQPCVLPIHLADKPDEAEEEEEQEQEQEEQEQEDIETEELMRTMASKFAPSVHYRWRRSRWLRNCPVALAEGHLKPGKAEYTVSFMDKLYVLSSAVAMEKFMKNPRPYLLPPQPKAPCKLVVVGPPFSGKTQLAFRLSDAYGAQVLNIGDRIQAKLTQERIRLKNELREETTTKTIESIKARREQERAAAEQALKTAGSDSQLETKSGAGSDEEEEEEEQETKKEADDEHAKKTLGSESQNETKSGNVSDQEEEEKQEEEKAKKLSDSEPKENAEITTPRSEIKSDDGSDKEEQFEDEPRKEVDDEESVTSDTPEEKPVAQPSIEDVAEMAPPDEPSDVPIYVDERDPEVVAAVEETMRTANFDNIDLPVEVYIQTVEEAVAAAEQERLINNPKAPRYGGWVIDDLPFTKEHWAALVERNKSLPDNIIFLQDDNPNADLLIERWYLQNKQLVDERFREHNVLEKEKAEASKQIEADGASDADEASVSSVERAQSPAASLKAPSASLKEAPSATASLKEAPTATASLHAPSATVSLKEAPTATASLKEAPTATASLKEAPTATASLHAPSATIKDGETKLPTDADAEVLKLPESPEVEVHRQNRKQFDQTWSDIQKFLTDEASLEPVVVDVFKKIDEESGEFVARSRNEITDEVLNVLSRPFQYQAWERSGVDIEEEEAEEEEQEEEEKGDEEEEEAEEEQETDPNRDPKKVLGDTNFYCPVALVEKGVLWPGDPECGAKFREKTYYLSDNDARDKFIANPSLYVPKDKPFLPPPIRLLMLGPHGAGKTVHGRELARKLGLFHIQFRERLQEMVLGKMKKRVRPEREEEQEADEQELPPEEVEEDDEVIEDEEEAEEDADAEAEKTAKPAEAVSATTLGEKEEEENDEATSEAARLTSETSTTVLSASAAEEDEDKEEEEEHEEEIEQKLTEDEEAIVAYLKDDEPLPSELLQKILNEWWNEEPFKSTGFIIEGVPYSPDDAALLAESGMFPDAAVVFEIESGDAVARLFPPRIARWRKRRKELLERRQRRKDRKRQKWDAAINRRRQKLKVQAEKKKAEREAAKVEDQEDEEDEDANENDEEEEDIEAIIAEEFGEFEEEEEEELETEEDAIERMKSEISETFDSESERVTGVVEKLQELMIPCISLPAGRKPHIIRYLLTKKLQSIIQHRYSMFERVYSISNKLAKKLLACGHKQLSRFGYWCPVLLLDGDWMQPQIGPDIPTYPAIYRQHIYFLSSLEARQQFSSNPLAFLCQSTPKPVVPIRLAIVGPPKSGKSTVARRFVKEFGVMRLSIGEALRIVLCTQPNTDLSLCIRAYLLEGYTVPDELAVQALEVVLMDMRCRKRGYILDGYPVTKAQVALMEQRNIIPVNIIELEIDGRVCADRATADRYSKDRILPLHDSAQIFTVKMAAWHNEVGPVRNWYMAEHDNWVSVPGDRSRWWVWNEALEIAKKSVVQIQTYLQRISEGKAASIADMCISPDEFKRRLGEFGEYCPVNLAEQNEYVDCSSYPKLTYAAEFQGLYYKMEGPEQLAIFLENAANYVPPNAPNLLPPPEKLPRRRTAAEAKQLFPMPIDLRGYCPVTFLDGNLRYEAIVPGNPELVVEYKGKLYYMETEEKLQKFMRLPEKYCCLQLPHKLPPKREPLVVTNLPMLGYMEQTVAVAITKALTAVGMAKPKYPFLSTTKSALLYVAIHLKAFNPNSPEYIRKKYRKKLEQFEETCELIRYLGRHMTKRYKEPQERPIDFDFKLNKFIQLQNVTLVAPAGSIA